MRPEKCVNFDTMEENFCYGKSEVNFFHNIHFITLKGDEFFYITQCNEFVCFTHFIALKRYEFFHRSEV